MNNQVNQPNLKSLAMFSINDFRDFFNDQKVWGKDSRIHLDDELVHVLDEGVITTYTNELVDLDNVKPFKDNIWENHSNKASVYIETGYLFAEDKDSCTKYVRNTLIDNNWQEHRWSSTLEDVIRAWMCEDYRDLRLD